MANGPTASAQAGNTQGVSYIISSKTSFTIIGVVMGILFLAAIWPKGSGSDNSRPPMVPASASQTPVVFAAPPGHVCSVGRKYDFGWEEHGGQAIRRREKVPVSEDCWTKVKTPPGSQWRNTMQPRPGSWAEVYYVDGYRAPIDPDNDVGVRRGIFWLHGKGLVIVTIS